MSETTAKYNVNEYEYEGQKLNRPIAEELIIELFAGKKNVKKAEIKDAVLREHSKRGGIEYTRLTTPVTDALKNLRDKELATNKEKIGYWTFKAEETTKGNNEVNKTLDDAHLQKHIEQECILGSFNRLRPIIESASKDAAGKIQGKEDLRNYVELERLALELARYALDYYEITYKNKE